MKTVFQLLAKGMLARGGISGHEPRGTINSKHIFIDRETATAYIPEFIEMCCNPKHDHDFYYLERDGVEVVVLELILVEGTTWPNTN